MEWNAVEVGKNRHEINKHFVSVFVLSVCYVCCGLHKLKLEACCRHILIVESAALNSDVLSKEKCKLLLYIIARVTRKNTCSAK